MLNAMPKLIVRSLKWRQELSAPEAHLTQFQLIPFDDHINSQT